MGMILSVEELKKYISGAVYFEEKDGIIPYRFTKEKLQTVYDVVNKIRHNTATGIRIEFYSDTEEIFFKYTAFTKFSSSVYKLYYFDVYVDDALVLHQGAKNVEDDMEGTIHVLLGKGYKHITIYLPGSCSVKISDFSISSGAKIERHTYDKNVIFFGDSITHAAYIDFPSMNYTNILSRKLNYNYVNQAIGGDVFDKKHLRFLPDFRADAVFVAYGTNDWRWENETSRERIEEYFSTLNDFYGNIEINVILPIWRGDMNENTEFKYSFWEIRNIIRKTAEKYDANVYDLIECIPHDKILMHDGFLHPNECGFRFYADALEKCLNGEN